MTDPALLPPLPENHLDHPENWATGADPATGRQKGFIKVLENKNPELTPSDGLEVGNMGKSEASEVIEKLKSGVAIHNDVQEDAGQAFDVSLMDVRVGVSSSSCQERQVPQLPAPVRAATAGNEDATPAEDTVSALVDKSTEPVNGEAQDTKTEEDDLISIEQPAPDNLPSTALEKEQSTLDAAFQPAENGHAKRSAGAGEEINKERQSKKARVEAGDEQRETAAQNPGQDQRKRATTVSMKVKDAQVSKAQVSASDDAAQYGYTSATPANPDPPAPDAFDTAKPARAVPSAHSESAQSAQSQKSQKSETSERSENSAQPETPAQASNAVAAAGGVAGIGNCETADSTPGDGAHLAHPDNWTTGGEPATDRQKGYIRVLEKQKGVHGENGDAQALGKSEASVKIEQLKSM